MQGEIIEQALLRALLRRPALALVRLPRREEVRLLLGRRLAVRDEVLEGLHSEGSEALLGLSGFF